MAKKASSAASYRRYVGPIFVRGRIFCSGTPLATINDDDDDCGCHR